MNDEKDDSARAYSYGDIAMLMAAQKVAESFSANIVSLAPSRTDWTPEYASALKARINAGLDQLGIDSKKDLRKATEALNKIKKPAQEDLAFFKTQVDVDFKNAPAKRTEILKTLGFTKNLRKVQNGNQEAIIELLYTFKVNMTADLEEELTAKGMTQTSIERIIGYAVTLNNANVTQETFKDTSKEVTKEVADALNGIYNEVIGICKKAVKVFAKEPLKKSQFVFGKIVKQLGTSPSKPKEPAPEKAK